MSLEFEVRGGLEVEIRAEGQSVRVSGYAAVFNEKADIAGLFTEVVAPGAFRSSIGRDDVVLLVNHGGLPLARTKSGTLKLSEDSRGLRVESELDATDPDVARIIPKLKRGDLNGMSFGFRAEKQTWGETGDGKTLRRLESVSLQDVSIVSSPAYAGTEIALRSLNDDREAKKALGKHNSDAAQRRIAARKAESEMRFRGIPPANK